MTLNICKALAAKRLVIIITITTMMITTSTLITITVTIVRLMIIMIIYTQAKGCCVSVLGLKSSSRLIFLAEFRSVLCCSGL